MTKEEYFFEINGVKVFNEVEPGIFQIEHNKFIVYKKNTLQIMDNSVGTLLTCNSLEEAKEFLNNEIKND